MSKSNISEVIDKAEKAATKFSNGRLPLGSPGAPRAPKTMGSQGFPARERWNLTPNPVESESNLIRLSQQKTLFEGVLELNAANPSNQYVDF